MTKTKQLHEFLWIDIETTGLIPAEGRILEVAFLLADDAHDGTMQAVEEFSAVIHEPNAASYCDEYVLKMHTRNGLLAECSDPEEPTLAECEGFMIEVIDGLVRKGKARGIVLAGASVHFDKKWLEHHMVDFVKRCSHRIFDVTTLTRAAETWGVPFERVKRDKHRALPDILASLEDARRVREAMRKWGTS